MNGSDLAAGMANSLFWGGCLTFLAGAGVGIGLWVAIPALCRFIAAHWH